MDLVSLIRNGTAAECRQAGELLVNLADMPRDAAWEGIVEAVAAKFRSPRDEEIFEHMARWQHRERQWSAALWKEGVAYTQLFKAELERRGDARTPDQFVRDVTADGCLVSDVKLRPIDEAG